MLTVSLVTVDMSTCGGFVLLLLGMKLQETELKFMQNLSPVLKKNRIHVTSTYSVIALFLGDIKVFSSL